MIWALDMLGPSCIVILREGGERACIKCSVPPPTFGSGGGRRRRRRERGVREAKN
jgi:hypothetical protein